MIEMIENTLPDFETLLRDGAVQPSLELEGLLDSLGVAYGKSSEKIVLEESLEVLEPETILGKVLESTDPSWLAGLDFSIYRAVGSTNDVIMHKLSEPGDHLRLCLAEFQSAGKGRRGRNWVSPFGRNIYLTLGCFLQMPLSSLGGLSIIAGMQVVDVLREAGIKDIGLKWPNDVLLNGGKLAGTLVELRAAEGRGIGVVIGVGINFSISRVDAIGIEQNWSDMATYEGLSRNDLAGRLSSRLISATRVFSEAGFQPFVDQWPHYNLNAGCPVNVIRGEEMFEGIDRGIDKQGNLLLETSSGLQIHNSGEVSLRPLAK